MIEVAAAFVLILSALAKALQILGGANPAAGLIRRGGLLAILIESAFLLALWLFASGLGSLRFVVVVAWFSIFAVVGGDEAMHAVQSAAVIGQAGIGPQVLCGCLQDCQGGKNVRDAVEGVARAIRAADGNIINANAFNLLLREDSARLAASCFRRPAGRRLKIFSPKRRRP